MSSTVIPNVNEFNLDAYGHLSWIVGWSDDCRDESLNEMQIVAKAAAEGLTDEEINDLVEESELGERGDWLACADFDRKGDFVAFHVVVNSDSGGFIETVEQGVYTLEEARMHLPGLLETWDDHASEQLVNDGQWFTSLERKESLDAIKRWKEALAKDLM